MTTSELDTYLAICERDVDLVLVMALRAEPTVASLIAKIANSPTAEVLSVRHSKCESDGSETDIEVRFGVPECPYVVLIENKVDAQFQPSQPDRYARRVEALREELAAGGATSLLVAPERYLEWHDTAAQPFEAVLSYETLRDALAALGSRWGAEAAVIIEHGITKHRRGVNTSEPVTSFFHKFARLGESQKLAGIPPGRGYAAGARHFWYPRDATLEQCPSWELTTGSQGAWLRIDFASGQVVIDLATIRRVIDDQVLRAEFADDWPFLGQRGQSFCLGVELDPVDPSQPIEIQEREASELVQAAARLKSWWHASGRERLERIVASAR